jgi:hypothetical protein
MSYQSTPLCTPHVGHVFCMLNSKNVRSLILFVRPALNTDFAHSSASSLRPIDPTLAEPRNDNQKKRCR